MVLLNKTTPLGWHVIVELYDCNKDVLLNQTALEEAMKGAAKESGARIVKSVFHQFSPYGVSGVVVIEESHFALHTWPEHNYAAVDLFTCSEQIDYKLAVDFLEKHLKAGKVEYKVLERGEKIMQGNSA